MKSYGIKKILQYPVTKPPVGNRTRETPVNHSISKREGGSCKEKRNGVLGM